MKLSARNLLKGKIIQIVKGAVNSEVILELPGGTRIVSIITNTSVDSFGLKEGKDAMLSSRLQVSCWLWTISKKIFIHSPATSSLG